MDALRTLSLMNLVRGVTEGASSSSIDNTKFRLNNSSTKLGSSSISSDMNLTRLGVLRWVVPPPVPLILDDTDEATDGGRFC